MEDRRRLPGVPALLSRLERRRRRGSPGDHLPARSPRLARRGRGLDLALLPVADEGLRLRRRGLLRRRSALRNPRRLRPAPRRRARARAEGHRRLGAEPLERSTPLVPGLAPEPGGSTPRLVRLARPGAGRRAAQQLARDLRRRGVDARSRDGAVLPPLLPARAAGPQLAEPGAPARDARHPPVLARPRRGRVPDRRRPPDPEGPGAPGQPAEPGGDGRLPQEDGRLRPPAPPPRRRPPRRARGLPGAPAARGRPRPGACPGRDRRDPPLRPDGARRLLRRGARRAPPPVQLHAPRDALDRGCGAGGGGRDGGGAARRRVAELGPRESRRVARRDAARRAAGAGGDGPPPHPPRDADDLPGRRARPRGRPGAAGARPGSFRTARPGARARARPGARAHAVGRIGERGVRGAGRDALAPAPRGRGAEERRRADGRSGEPALAHARAPPAPPGAARASPRVLSGAGRLSAGGARVRARARRRPRAGARELRGGGAARPAPRAGCGPRVHAPGGAPRGVRGARPQAARGGRAGLRTRAAGWSASRGRGRGGPPAPAPSARRAGARPSSRRGSPGASRRCRRRRRGRGSCGRWGGRASR